MFKTGDNIRATKIEKYMGIVVNSGLVNGGLKTDNSFGSYIIGIDLALDSDMFYGINVYTGKYEPITTEQFDDCDIVLRLTSWHKDENGKEEYYFRIIKANKDDYVNFKEEKEYLRARML